MVEGVTEQRVSINVAGGGYPECLPDLINPFCGASLLQSVSIELGPEATLVYGDMLAPGQVAGGESFRYRSIRNRVDVCQQRERPTYLEAHDLAVRSEQRMGLAASR